VVEATEPDALRVSEGACWIEVGCIALTARVMTTGVLEARRRTHEVVASGTIEAPLLVGLWQLPH
jgi:hypothetical protein